MCVRNENAAIRIDQPHRHGVAADAAAGDLSSSSSVERLCGQPEQKAAGARADRLRRLRRHGRSALASTLVASAFSTSHRTLAILSGSSSPDRRESAICRGPPDAPADRRESREAASRGSCASLRPPGSFRARRRNRLTNSGSSGKGIPTFPMRTPSRDAQIAQRLHQVVIGFPGAEDADRAPSRRYADSRRSIARTGAPPPDAGC